MPLAELLISAVYIFMQFRDWLLNEDFGDGGTSWDLLYPTTGGDYADVNNDPLSHFWLQWKWDRGTDPEIGRTLYNIDNDEFQKVGYASIESRTMPEAGNDHKFWTHKPDDGSKSSIKPYHLPELRWVAMGKTSKETKFVDRDGAGKVKIWAGHGGATSSMHDENLDDIFHDEDRHTHKWPSVDEKYMDDDWTKPEHRPKQFKEWLAEYGLAAGTSASLPWGGHHSDGDYNRNPDGPASKWATKNGKNNTNQDQEMPDPDVAFGYKRRPKDKIASKRAGRTIHKRDIRPKRVDVSDIIY